MKKKKINYVIVSCQSELLALGFNLFIGKSYLVYGLLCVFGPIHSGVCFLVKVGFLVLLGKAKI